MATAPTPKLPKADPVVEAAMKENHRSGPNYKELMEMFESEKARAEKFGEQLNAVRLVIMNPLLRMGPFVDATPLGRILELNIGEG